VQLPPSPIRKFDSPSRIGQLAAARLGIPPKPAGLIERRPAPGAAYRDIES
jgi:hypothetical protein